MNDREPVDLDAIEWAVFRWGPDLPAELCPPGLNGYWLKVGTLPTAPSIESTRKAAQQAESAGQDHLVMEAVAVPTEEVVTRMVPVQFAEDPRPIILHDLNSPRFVTQTGRIWEIRPVWKVDEAIDYGVKDNLAPWPPLEIEP